jgi:hypothetical protein
MPTPKTHLDILDNITAPRIARPRRLSLTARTHFERVRTIFEDENIVGAGIARKVIEDRRTPELGIIFYVREKLSPSNLRPGQLLPPVIAAANGKAIFTDVVEIGDIVPQLNVQQLPLQSGFSIGHPAIAAGTLGAVVRSGGKQFLLSNAHVLANSGLGAPGDAIVYPGPEDGGVDPANVVARLRAFTKFAVGQTFTNKVDAALAEIDPAVLQIDPLIPGASMPLKVAAPKRDMRVMKRGRTTGDTESVVRDADFRILVRYAGVGTVGFTGQVLCETYTGPGDSGAIVVAKKTGKIVGLHFAGSSRGSVFTPIKTVMQALQFTF